MTSFNNAFLHVGVQYRTESLSTLHNFPVFDSMCCGSCTFNSALVYLDYEGTAV